MNKLMPIIFTCALLFLSACRENPLLPAPESVPITDGAVFPQGDPSATLAPDATPLLDAAGSSAVPVSVPGLRVMYLREGNLWSWTESNGSV